ncbi:MAG TPA: choice-of-anchor D domain-containing protein, partial [Candidatus Eisenbacteria bacterium]|nr:choice-of-anchor D domain-containing protein [Candidatus Eisenbacteria bacterium]
SAPIHQAGATVLVVEDVLPWFSAAVESLLMLNDIVYDVIPSSALGGTDLSPYQKVIVPSDQPTSLYDRVAERAAQINDYVLRGGVLEFHASWGWSAGDPTRVTLPGGMEIRTFISEFNHVLQPGHALMRDVPDPITGVQASLSYFANIPANATQIATDDQGQTALVVYPFGAGRVIASGQTLEFGYQFGYSTGTILRNMIPFMFGSDWLSIAPSSGTLQPGGQIDLAVTFDAKGLPGGDYHRDIIIISNDPDESPWSVPADLHVTGAPDITLSRSEIDFGTLFIGAARSESLMVGNRGTEVLTVTEITPSRGEYQVDPAAGFSLAPGTSRWVSVTFRPGAAGPTPGVLTIRSNDPDAGESTVALTGTGQIPPDISIAPRAVLEDILQGQTSVRPLTISNDGASPLTVDIAVRLPAIAVAAVPGAPLVVDAVSRSTMSELEKASYRERYREATPSGSTKGSSALVGRLGGGRAVRAATAAVPPGVYVLYSDDMEGGPGGWSHYSTDSIGVDLWGRTTGRSNSGAWSWRVSQHDFQGSDALQSPLIDLSGVLDATLTFEHWHD